MASPADLSGGAIPTTLRSPTEHRGEPAEAQRGATFGVAVGALEVVEVLASYLPTHLRASRSLG